MGKAPLVRGYYQGNHVLQTSFQVSQVQLEFTCTLYMPLLNTVIHSHRLCRSHGWLVHSTLVISSYSESPYMEIHCTKLNIWCYKASDIQKFKILIKQLFYCRLLDKRLVIASLVLGMRLLFFVVSFFPGFGVVKVCKNSAIITISI